MRLLIDGKWIGNPEKHEESWAEVIARYNKVKELKKQREDEDERSSDELQH